MAKTRSGRKGSKENPITVKDDIFDDQGKVKEKKPDYLIMEAHIKDDFCNYTYEMNVGVPDAHNVKGKGIVMDDMKNAFAKFNVHLAVIDDAFKLGNVEIADIDTHHADEITYRYEVTGFKIKGSKEDPCIILYGTKRVSYGDRIALESPKIPLDRTSSFKWTNELKAAADTAREEVRLYKEGKYIYEEKEDEEHLVISRKKSRQSKITDPEAAADNPEITVMQDEQEKSKISDDAFKLGVV